MQAFPWTNRLRASSAAQPFPRSPASLAYAREPGDLIIDFDSANSAASDEYFCADEACDRTVSTTTAAGWTKYPLLADAPDTEDAISGSDTTYQCQISHDDGTKTDSATPTGGCCGAATQVVTGLAGSGARTHAWSAHLEPGANGVSACATPTY
jgi:hypothetical protein